MKRQDLDGILSDFYEYNTKYNLLTTKIYEEVEEYKEALKIVGVIIN